MSSECDQVEVVLSDLRPGAFTTPRGQVPAQPARDVPDALVYDPEAAFSALAIMLAVLAGITAHE